MNWQEIMKYETVIKKIAMKYSGDSDLAEDVAHEVMLKLIEDKKLDISKFPANKRDAAVRNTIRNKTIKVLRSKKIGRFTHESLDSLSEGGFQIDAETHIVYGPTVDTRKGDYIEQGQAPDFVDSSSSDNNTEIEPESKE